MDVGDELESGRREPAPGRLHLVQLFLNTVDLTGDDDVLGEPCSAARWLRDQGLLRGAHAVTADERAGLVRLREALRTLVVAHNGEPVDPKAVRLVNRIAADSPLGVHVDPADGPVLVPAAHGVSGAMAAILGAVQAASVEGTWLRLKGCREHTCRWAFSDHSRNRSSTWCSMAICGNRAKARAFRTRTRSRARS